jgi:hypothetical protein
MHMADGDEPGVVDPLTDDSQRTDERLPRWVDIRGFCQERKLPLKYGCLRLRIRDRQPQTIKCLGRVTRLRNSTRF